MTKAVTDERIQASSVQHLQKVILVELDTAYILTMWEAYPGAIDEACAKYRTKQLHVHQHEIEEASRMQTRSFVKIAPFRAPRAASLTASFKSCTMHTGSKQPQTQHLQGSDTAPNGQMFNWVHISTCLKMFMFERKVLQMQRQQQTVVDWFLVIFQTEKQ
jgi:hypothetical protein